MGVFPGQGNFNPRVRGMLHSPCEGINGEDLVAYSTNDNVFSGGMSRNEVRQYYDEWADKYDLHDSPEKYHGPSIAAKFCCDVIPQSQRPHVLVLDVAAGTGFLGQELHRRGFRNIHALDPSAGMLEQAKAKNIYQEYFNEFITEEDHLPVDPDTYDCVVSSGGMGQGHIPPGALWEMLRITKRGGYIITAMREEYLRDVEYDGKLEPLMACIQASGKWSKIGRVVVPDYFLGKPGVVFTYAKS